ncbi:hypothetical protein Tco_1261286 [Tanacetum coccineum]
MLTMLGILSLLLYLENSNSLNDEEDTRSSKEYMNDLELEFHERALLAQSKRNQGLVTEAYEWDEEEVSLDDNGMVEIKVLMELVVDECSVVGKESVKNGDRVKISIRKSRRIKNRNYLCECEVFLLQESFRLFHWDKFTNICGRMACIASGACDIRALKQKDMEMEG